MIQDEYDLKNLRSFFPENCEDFLFAVPRQNAGAHPAEWTACYGLQPQGVGGTDSGDVGKNRRKR